MLENKHNLTVDTQSKSIGNAFVEVVQNDNVALEVQIYNNNLLVDNTAYTYTLLSVLPSKERIIRQGSIGPNGYPVFNLGIEEMSETGIILAMVQVYDELGNRVTSYDFKYRMKEDLSTGGVVPNADNPKFVIITEDSLSQTVQDAQQSKIELDEMKTDTEGVTHLSPNDRLVSDYNKINNGLKNVNTQLAGISIIELKIKNNVINGNFSTDSNGDGLADSWSLIGATTPSLQNGEQTFLPTIAAGYLGNTIVNPPVIGSKVYAYAEIKTTDSATKLNIFGATTKAHSGSGEFEKISAVVTTINSNALRVTTFKSSGFVPIIVRKYIAVDLTTMFGAGNEPTKEEMDTLINILGGFFDGEVSVTQKQCVTWLLNLMRQNRNAILALGGTIV